MICSNWPTPDLERVGPFHYARMYACPAHGDDTDLSLLMAAVEPALMELTGLAARSADRTTADHPDPSGDPGADAVDRPGLNAFKADSCQRRTPDASSTQSGARRVGAASRPAKPSARATHPASVLSCTGQPRVP